jgi:DNA modification methylase
MTDKKIENVDSYEFEPIKGYPMLNWSGKRPFRSTQYFPAQLKEVYGKEDENGWINKIFWGDNLQVLGHVIKNFRNQINLIYIDPPFDSNADYKKRIKLKGKKIDGDSNSFEEKQYTDIWTNDGYLQFMYERLIFAKDLLKDDGAIFLHCDPARSHYLKIILDEIFGADNFINEISWQRSGAKGLTSNQFPDAHDVIFYYAKNKKSHVWHKQHGEYSSEHLKKYRYDDGDGRVYMMDNLQNPNPDRPNLTFEFNGHLRCWRWTKERMAQAKQDNRIAYAKNGMPYLKRYLDESDGPVLTDIWTDISPINSQAKERLNYPTQKPATLLERIINCSTVKGDLVFDFFMGSGTTQSVANKLGRSFLGADINLGAIQTTSKRLVNDGANFEVYSINNYEFFRNPIEAKDLLMDALEVQPLNDSTIFDGEKDGFKVKVMPVNRIASKEDLNELISNLPYKTYEKRKAELPNKPVEDIMLICMGHEPGLGALLENECGYKLNIEVVDILRDKSNLTFKYDAEASIEVNGNKLTVNSFYPRNLLQKLSQQKDDITEWREMVESIMIDWSFDGAVMEPMLIDVPDKNEFVSGEYDIPEGASNIKIKITDLLSESYEEVISYGQ